MSLSQELFIFFGCVMIGLIYPVAKSFKGFLLHAPIVVFAALGWRYVMENIFHSTFYRGVEALIPFTLGF